MDYIQITDQIKFLPGLNHSRFPYGNSLLIEDRHRAIIDTGLGDEQLNIICPDSINMVINTHYHYDHVGANHLFKQAEVWVHPLDAPPMRCTDKFLEYTCFSIWPKLMDSLDSLPIIKESNEVRMKHNPLFHYRQIPTHHDLYDGQVIDFGVTELTVLHLPGHTSGHCGFYEAKSGVLFSADVDAADDWGPWYGHLYSDVDDFIASIKRLELLKPSLLLMSHQPPLDKNIDSVLKRYLSRIYERDERILRYLTELRTVNEIAAQYFIYGKQINILSEFWEKMMVVKHLEHLVKQGTVKKLGEAYVKV